MIASRVGHEGARIAGHRAGLVSEAVDRELDACEELPSWVLLAHVLRDAVARLSGDAGKQVVLERQRLSAVGDGVAQPLEALEQRKRLGPLAQRAA